MKFTEPRPRLKTARVVRITDRRDRRARIERLLLLDESTVIGITNDESGISHDPDARFEVARKIVERAE